MLSSQHYITLDDFPVDFSLIVNRIINLIVSRV